MIKISPLWPGTVIFALLFPAFLFFPAFKGKTSGEHEKIKIGFLIPMPVEEDDLSREAYYGAQLAIEESNQNAGTTGKIFKMITLSTNGPWGSGSKRAVKLVYDDQVCGMVISLDGRNAHLAEQVITKARVALIVTRATDPTITKAFVPWVFRIVPNDEQQARFLTTEIYKSRNFRKLVLLTPDSYDAKGGAQAFLQSIKASHFPSPVQITFNAEDVKNNFIEKIHEYRPDAIAVFGLPEEMGSLIAQIDPDIPLFGSLSLLYDNTLAKKLKTTKRKIFVVSPGFLTTGNGKTFQRKFQERYGFLPGVVAANAYEGMKLMIRAARESSPDRDKIREYLLSVKDYPGINGTINFEQNGNLESWKGQLISLP